MSVPEAGVATLTSPRRRLLLVSGPLAMFAVVIGWLVNPRTVAASVLVAYLAPLSVVLGVLATNMIAHVTGARWFCPLRPQAEAVMRSMPLIALVGVIALFSRHLLASAAAGGSAVRLYASTFMVVARTVICWAIWMGIARALRAARRDDLHRSRKGVLHRCQNVSAAGLIALAVTMTITAFDWIMVLTPDWQSTIIGVYWFAGGMVGALALLAVLAPKAAHANREHTVALGSLLLTFVLFWIYIAFSQYIVIWSGGIPREMAWYLPRADNGWGAVALILIVGHFAMPFLGMLPHAVRRSGGALAMIGMALLGLHYVDSAWMVMPGLVALHWWTCALALATGWLVLWPLMWLPP